MQHQVTLTTILIFTNLIITTDINLMAGGGAETMPWDGVKSNHKVFGP
jgi:hypothetical protein